MVWLQLSRVHSLTALDWVLDIGDVEKRVMGTAVRSQMCSTRQNQSWRCATSEVAVGNIHGMMNRADQRKRSE